mgnify:CR=1 FL=1
MAGPGWVRCVKTLKKHSKKSELPALFKTEQNQFFNSQIHLKNSKNALKHRLKVGRGPVWGLGPCIFGIFLTFSDALIGKYPLIKLRSVLTFFATQMNIPWRVVGLHGQHTSFWNLTRHVVSRRTGHASQPQTGDWSHGPVVQGHSRAQFVHRKQP